MLATEKRSFFKLEVRVDTPSVVLNNLEFKFNKLTLYSEYDDSSIVIENRRVVFEPERTLEGFRTSIYILNESDTPTERIDYLFDEEYEIEELDIEIKSTTGVKYEFYINNDVGEQVEDKEVEIEVSPEMSACLNFISSYIVDEENKIVNTCYDFLKDEEEAINALKLISEINIL